MKKPGKIKFINSNETSLRSEHILNENTSFAVTEAYKTTRTNLQYISNDDGCNVIAVTSSVPGEGKTYISISKEENSIKEVSINSIKLIGSIIFL